MGEFSKEAHQKDTFHLAEGAYLLKSADVLGSLMVNLKGGYVAAEEYSVRDPFSNQSVISGSVSTKESECLTVQVKAPEKTEITLDGVVLESAADESVVVTSSGEGSSVVLKGCILRKAAPRNCDDQLDVEDYVVWIGSGIVPLGHTFDNIGRFVEDQVWMNDEGCDVTTRYVVDVIPRAKTGTHDYYVKQNGSGKKDGTSWTDAMSDSAFAYSFGKVEEGATFHVAAGVYHPIYDKNGEDDNASLEAKLHKVFYTDKNVNVLGGYPADAEENAVRDTANHTVFTGEVQSLNITVGEIMRIEPSKAGSIHISGVRFDKTFQFSQNRTEAALCINPAVAGVIYQLDSCRITTNYGNLFVANACGGRMNRCDFSTANDAAKVIAAGTSTDSLVVKNSSFNCAVEVEGYSYAITNSAFQSIILGDQVASTPSNGSVAWSSAKTLSVYPNSSCELRGNMIETLYQVKSAVQSSYNLFVVNNSTYAGGATDRLVGATQFASLFESGEMTMAYNDNAFNQTFALAKDTLPDGTSIRIPRGGETKDMMGHDRQTKTCPGSYEWLDPALTGLDCVEADGSRLSDIMCPGYTTRFYDALGRCVVQTQAGWETFSSNNTLPTGVYLYLVITTEGKRYGGKISINKAE